MRSLVAVRCLLIFGLALGVEGAASARPDVIYQAFNERFTDIVPKLDQLVSLGYTYVQVSPPQKSAANPIWWGRYQPIDYSVIDGPLGTEADLAALTAAAHQHGLKVLIDTVLNHMASVQYNNNSLQYPQFGPQDFHFPTTRPCIADYNNRTQVTTYWLCDPANNNYLPDLDTSSTYVRNIHKAYLLKLLGLGADGFRFDAAKSIETNYWPDVLGVIPPDHFYYGEVIGSSTAEDKLYTPFMKVTDFHLLSTMIGSFSFNGDLRNLVDPEAANAALPGPDAVVFARNHDTAMHSDFFNFGDYQDALLATAFVVGRGVGTPAIYRDDFAQAQVVNAIRFADAMDGQAPFVRTADQVCGAGCDPRTLLFVVRGNSGLMIINSANATVDAAAAHVPGLAPGCYRELGSNFPVVAATGGDGQTWISRWNSPARGGLNIGPRTVLFLTQRQPQDCQ